MGKKSNILWGLIFILIAVLIIFNQLGYFNGVGLPSLIVSILLVPVIITSVIHVNFAGILFPLAVIGILYDDLLGIQNLTPWPLLLTALFLTIGLSFLFPRHRRYKSVHDEGFDVIINEPDGSEINLDARFCGSVKYVNTHQLEVVNIDCSFAGLKVYFDQANLMGDTAIINFDLDFAGAELYIPKSWRIVDNIHYTLGGMEEAGRMADIAEKTITLNGKANFSGVKIIYI